MYHSYALIALSASAAAAAAAAAALAATPAVAAATAIAIVMAAAILNDEAIEQRRNGLSSEIINLWEEQQGANLYALISTRLRPVFSRLVIFK